METPDQFDRLARGGCRSVQGHLISRPIGARDVDAFLEAPRAWMAANTGEDR